MADLVIRDCGPRDGLQPLEPLAPPVRAELSRRLRASGLARVEVASFVSPRAVPAMADGAAVLRDLGEDDAWWVLVPNARGAELALDAGARRLTVTASASEGYSQKNTGMSIEQALDEFDRIRRVAEGATLDLVLSCCFGSPFEPISAREVANLVARLRSAGADEVTLADTTGTATPRRLDDLLDLVGLDCGLHLHDSRGTALVNAYSAFKHGITRFDTALGGLGGSPFAPGAGGNLATEDLVLLMEDLGVDTGISLEALLETASWLSEVLGRQLPGRVAAAGGLEDWSS